MKKKIRRSAAIIMASLLLGNCGIANISVQAAETELCSGYYMASDENNIRAEADINSKILGRLDNITVYNFDSSSFVTDENGCTFVKLTDIALYSGETLPSGYLCVTNCYYLGDESNRYVYRITEETVDVWDSWRNATSTVTQLYEGDTFTAMRTNDMWLYCPEMDAWLCSWYVEQTDLPVEYAAGTPYMSANYNCNSDCFYNENMRKIFQHFVEQGFPKSSAAAIAVNLYKESCCEPDVGCIDTNGLESYGICQWNGARNNKMRNWCSRHRYNWNTLEGQLAYLDWELQNDFGNVYRTLMELSDIYEDAYFAGWTWASSFEVCSKKYWKGRAQESGNFFNNMIA